jgi:hypothetical protein
MGPTRPDAREEGGTSVHVLRCTGLSDGRQAEGRTGIRDTEPMWDG